VSAHGTVPLCGHGAVVHVPFTHVWFEAQQTPLQQMGLTKPHMFLPHSVPYAHLPLWQIAPGPQHSSPHRKPLQHTLLPLRVLRHLSSGPQHVFPHSSLPLQQNSLPELSFMHLPLQHW